MLYVMAVAVRNWSAAYLASARLAVWHVCAMHIDAHQGSRPAAPEALITGS